jgi:hypothetical protein
VNRFERDLCGRRRYHPGQRIGLVVPAEQLQVSTLHDFRVHAAQSEHQRAGFAHEAADFALLQLTGSAEIEPAALCRTGQLYRCRIVAVQHPDAVRARVLEEPRLVCVVLVDALVTVEMIGREVGDDADAGREALDVGELKELASTTAQSGCSGRTAISDNASRCCPRQVRRDRRVAARARSAPSSCSCRSSL